MDASVINAASAHDGFRDPQEKLLDGMYLSTEKAELILKMLLDGMSVSATERVTGVHHGTILKLLTLAGERCEKKWENRWAGVSLWYGFYDFCRIHKWLRVRPR
jgi:hypothetical protein